MTEGTDALAAFLDAGAHAAALLSQPAVAEHWEEPSVLPELTVAGLSGHLLRGMSAVEQYLDGAPPDPTTTAVTASQYFDVLGVSPDLDAPGNVAIRVRANEMAAGGPEDVADVAGATLSRLTERLGPGDLELSVSVIGGVVITVGQYLRTRVVELTVHGDDLAASVGIDTPPCAASTIGVAVDVLIELAALRHGDMAVLRALARRERDRAQALRVL